MTLTATSESHPNALAQFLLRIVDFLIAALVFVLPFIMGGREAWGHWFLISTALLLGAVWAAYATVTGSRYSFSWLEYFFIAGLAIAWIQVQPQSAAVMNQFSPQYANLLHTWSETQPASANAEYWQFLSFSPEETRHGLWVFLAYGVIGLVVFQRVRQVNDCERLLKAIGLSGIAMTGFALLQWVTSNDRFFWFYEHPFTDPTIHLKGAFTNRNHFAQFLALSLGPLLWWLFADIKVFLNGGRTGSAPSPQSSRRSSKKRSKSKPRSQPNIGTSPQAFDRVLTIPLLAVFAGVAIVGLAVVLSLSRGGMIAAGAVFLIAMTGLWRGFKAGGAMAALIFGGGVLFFSMLAFTEQEELQTKLDQLLSTDADEIDMGGARRAIWAADAKIVQKFPWLGTGVGSHRDVYTLYMDDYADHAMAEMTHAESSFVNVALETGLVGLGLLTVALLLLLARLAVGYFRTQTESCRSCIVVVFACTIGAVLHGVVDFIWYAPAIVVTSLILVVVGLKTATKDFGLAAGGRGMWFPRLGWAISGGFCLLGLVAVQPELMARIDGEKHWYASLRTAMTVAFDESDGFADLKEGDVIELQEDTVPLSAEAQAQYDAAAAERRRTGEIKYLRERIGHLVASLKARPNQPRVQSVLAEQLLKLFDLEQVDSDNQMPLNMIRDAAVASQFSSAAELREWSAKSCGRKIDMVLLADRLARQSLAGCPTQGYAYLTLMETDFLNDPSDSMHQKLIDQAMTVRGHDPRVRFVAGREAIFTAMVTGDYADALELWGTVFHANSFFRLSILQMLAPTTGADFFLKYFDPNAEELNDLLAVYDALEKEDDSASVLRRICVVVPKEYTAIEDEDERLEAMMGAYVAARRLDELEMAVSLLKTTVEEFPYAFDPRYHMGMTLVELERGQEALEYLNWCYEREPSNIWLPKLIRRAHKQTLIRPEGDRITRL